ncbi:MAG: phosphotransferase [Desulfobulbaceae bacterium]|nr:phosphotransferase [Desulfobulbaceae bacterium]
MKILLKNQGDRRLVVAASEEVACHGPKWVLRSNDERCVVEVLDGKLERLHGGMRADVYFFERAGQRCCVKWFHDRRFVARLRNALGIGRAYLAYKKGLQLERLGVHAPRVLGVVRPRRFGAALLVMEMIDGYQQMNLMLEAWKEHSADLNEDPRLLKLAEQFGRFAGEVHVAGVLHKDFSPRNVLVNESGAGFTFCLIDLEDVDFGNNPHSNLEHFNERMPRYLNESEFIFYLKHFNKGYIGRY